MTEKFLETANIERDADGLRALYDHWAPTYEAEIGENGYATATRCAGALAEFATDKSLPLLDFGCGTGLGGVALKAAGFGLLDGVDLSGAMLAQARAKNIYRDLSQIDADATPQEEYALIAAIDVIGVGAAPISLLDTLMHALPSNGKLVFSFNDQTLADPASTCRLNEWLDCGAARLLFSEHGDHLPARDIGSTVYVVEKA